MSRHRRLRLRVKRPSAVALLLMMMMGTCALLPAIAEPYRWRLTRQMAPPRVPGDNPMSAAKVELGRRLFFDIRLSGPGYMACASCHKPELAFTDGRKVAIGVTGERHYRNTPTLANVAYLSRFGWATSARETLEVQMRRPMFSEEPIVEMGIRGHEVPVLLHVRSNSVYREMFRAAFPGRSGVIDFDTIAMAIASFQRTIVSGSAPYDRHLAGDRAALSVSARRGLELFKSNRLKCSRCHVPPFFTDAVGAAAYHNTGLYNREGSGRLPGRDQGLANDTGRREDSGRFRTPTLRNIAVTAPYMHDGSVATLEAVIEHYAAGGLAALRSKPSPLRSPLITGFTISPRERDDLLAFLGSLTDQRFLSDQRYRTPFR